MHEIKKKNYFIILNELNFFYFIFLVLIRRNVYLCKVRFLNKASTVPLNYIVKICYKYKLIKYLQDLEEIDLVSDRWIYDSYTHFDTEQKYDELVALFKKNRSYQYWNNSFNDYLYSF